MKFKRLFKLSSLSGLSGLVILFFLILGCQDREGSVSFLKEEEVLDTIIVQFTNVSLKPENEAPPIYDQKAEGLVNAILFSSGRIQFDISLSNLNVKDYVVTVQIHVGGPAVLGPLLLDLRASDLIEVARDATKVSYFTQAQLSLQALTLFKDPATRLYLNVRTILFGNGLLRGQLR